MNNYFVLMLLVTLCCVSIMLCWTPSKISNGWFAKHAIPFFFVMCLIIYASSYFSEKSRLELFSADSTIYYDSWIELQNISAASLDPVNNFLFADFVNGWARGTSGQRQVSVAWNRNYRCMWRVKGPLSSGPNLYKGKPVLSGDTIRLETVFDNVNLHSHPLRADYDDSKQFNEVTGFGFKELDDTNSHWIVTVDGGGTWTSSSKVSFQHANTSKFLTAPSKIKHNVFADPKKSCSLWLVGSAPSLSADSYWKVYRAEQPVARAVRMYKDVEMDEANLIEYQLTGSGKDQVLNTIRDGRVGHEFIKGMIIPQDTTVDIYRDSNKSNLIMTMNAGRWDNLQLGSCSTVVIRQYCPLIVYDQCDYTGNKTCIPFGSVKLLNDINSWVLADGSQATLFSATADWDLSSSQKAVTCKQVTNSAFGPVIEINTYPTGSSKHLYRSQTDLPSLNPIVTDALTAKLPQVSTSALQCYVNAAIPESCAGGKIWYDISGNNRHFVWDSNPRLVDGKFMSTDANGTVARGPPSNSFGLHDGTSGFTFAIMCQSYAPSDNWGCSFVSKNNDGHGLSCHLPESNSWNLSFCFDQGWGSPSQKNSRLLLPPTTTSWDKYAMNVIVCRRNGNSSDSLMSVWINGQKIAQNTTPSNELDLSVTNAMIFSNYKGGAQAFAIWSTAISDADIPTLTTHFHQTYAVNRQSIFSALISNSQKLLPNLSVQKGLTCLLDARDSRSAQNGNKIWKDLSGRGSHFTWRTSPKLSNNRFVSINQNGNGLVGPASDSFGIEQDGGGFTIFVVAKTNSLSQNQAFRFRGEVSNQRGIFAHATWTDGNMYFDQAGCCDTNVQRVSAAVPWKTFNVYTVRRTPNFNKSDTSNAKSNKLSIFINGIKSIEGSSAATNTRLSGQPAEIGGSSTENYDWDADLVAFAVYCRALSDGEVKVVADYLMTPNFGDVVNVDGKIDSSAGIQRGVCVAQTLQNNAYLPMDCLSKTQNSDGSYNVVKADGRGWCFTDAQDNSKWGWCKSNRTFDIEQTYDKSQALSYTAARDYCSAKGGRLCNIDEICDAGPRGRPHIGFDALSPSDCSAAGGTYNTQGKFCGTQDSGGSAPFVIPSGNAFVATNDDDNSWVNISGDDMSKMCQTYSSINGNTKPAWGTTADDLPQKRNVVCCGIGQLSKCDQITVDLQTINDKITSTTDPAAIASLQSSKNDLQNQQLQYCLTETYLKAVNDLDDAEAAYATLVSRLNDSKDDNSALLKSIFTLSSVIDKNNKSFLDSDDAQKNKGVPFDDGSFKQVGTLQNLQISLVQTQNAIAQRVAILNQCPSAPVCPSPPTSQITAPASGGMSCDPTDFQNALLNNPSMTPDKLQLLQSLLSPQNILKGTDIRNHKDFYKLVQSQNIQPCNTLGTGPVTPANISDFSIQDHPDFKSHHFIPLLSVPISRVPPDRLNDAQRLLGNSQMSS